VPAALARQLRTILLAKASALRPTMSLNAYRQMGYRVLMDHDDIAARLDFG